MNLKTEKKTFKGVDFETTQFPAYFAYELLAKISDRAAKAGWDPSMDITRMGPAMLDPELTLRILSSTRAILTENGRTGIVEITSKERFNQVFSGRLAVVFDVVNWVMETNYGDFSEGSDPAAPQSPEAPVG